MKVRHCLLSAAIAAMALGSAAWAADQSATPSVSRTDLALTPVYADAGTPTSLTPLMYELDKTSFGKTLEGWNMSISGFGEGGFFYNTSNPRPAEVNDPKAGSPTLIAFPGGNSNRGILDQADLIVQKTIDTTKTWDWGFFVEQGYGVDDAQIHSSGLVDNRVGRNPNNQYDIVQANATLLIPIGSGLQIEAGKFVTLLSEEVINPTGNLFYTHSYNFTFGVPATQTGVLAKYTFAKLVNGNDLQVIGGFTRGWNQSLRDGNGAIDFLGEASAKINDKTTLVFNLAEGPEENDPAHVNVGPFSATNKNLDGEYWTVPELIVSYAASDQLTLTGDLLYGDAPGDSFTDSGHAAQWYGAVAYASYKYNPYVTSNIRAEVYRDQGGATVEGISATYYELTVGAQIHPFPTSDILQWLQFRPEVRYDLSDRPVYNFPHDGTINGFGDYSEFTVAMDAIMQF